MRVRLLSMNRFNLLLLAVAIQLSGSAVAQNLGAARSKPQSVCDLPKLTQGTHKSIRLTAVASFGTDMGVLADARCPSTQPVWFELSLKSERNRNRLHDQLEKFGKARVVFSGELYGPPLPDPKLPDSIRKNYRGGWGHLGSFPMKLVVFRIESVAPAGKPYSE
jgi:hypothetical protein